jgi:hypothetical protein
MKRFKNDQTALSNSQYRILENLWLSFVQSEREKERMEPINLAHRRTKCNCGKSRMSHWPSSCHSAADQLCCLLGRSHPHRQYLTDCWLSSLFQKLASEGTEKIEAMITLVRNSCPVLQALVKCPQRRAEECIGSTATQSASQRSPTTTPPASATAGSIVKSAQCIVWW